MLVAEPCMTVYNPMDCALPGSSVRGILQARTLEWVDISFSMWHGRGTKMTEKSTSERKNIRHDPVKVESQEKHEAFFQLPSSLKKKKKIQVIWIQHFTLLMHVSLSSDAIPASSFFFFPLNQSSPLHHHCHTSEFAYTLGPYFLYHSSTFYGVLGFHTPRG